MNRRINVARMKAGLALALFGSMIGHLVPAYCEGQRSTDRGTLSQATTPTWVPTGNLTTARSWHTATLLPNGKVLVVGGQGGDPYPLDTAELYDPTTGTWSATGRLNAAKSGHTATLLPNGQVLVVGQADSAINSAELYDASKGTWRLTSSGAGHWRDHTATLLQTGKVLFAGGWAVPYDSYSAAALYDPATGSWSTTGRLTTLRGAGHQATLLQDGRVLVTGGSNDPDFSFGVPNAELYDPVAGTWTRASDLHAPRAWHSATVLPDGKVLLAGGDILQSYSYDPYRGGVPHPPTNTAELFDPATGNWSSTGRLNTGRSGHTASLLPNGEILVAGGWGDTPPIAVPLNKAERYDASGALWRDTRDLNTARSGHTATLLPNGQVLVAGGIAAGASAELYAQTALPGTIGPDITGAWYDPAQSGHGIFVQVLPEQRFYAAWFAFNPAGTQQAWFTGVGRYSGNSATITAVEQPTGGRWIPDFDPTQIVRNPWGTLTFSFTDCNHGRVDFSSVSGYGAGSMNLTRLTQPAGLSCE